MNDRINYDVQTILTFLIDFDYGYDVQTLYLPDLYKQFIRHVQDVYQKDETLREYTPKEAAFYFEECGARLEYRFSCHGENKAEAEALSARSVRNVQNKLEAFGCKLKWIECEAAEADITRLNQMEKNSGAASPANRGKKRSGQER